MEFELAYNDVAVQNIIHYTMGTSPPPDSLFSYMVTSIPI